jgi:hypothetical protein
MTALQTTRRGWTAPLAAVLLVFQGLAGGAVSIAHASEQTPASAAIEAEHTARCPVLHDAMKCPQCQYASAHAVVRELRGLRWASVLAEPHRTPAGSARAAEADHAAARPRAPPTLPS